MADGSAAVSLWDAWEKGIGSGLIRTAQWVAQDHGYLLPVLALLFVYGITRTGWQFKIPSLGQKLAALTKPVDLRDVFTGTRSLTRVQVLMTGATTTTQSHAAMLKAEALFTRWYGEGLWTPQAFDRSLQLAVIYPLLWMVAVWAVTGVGRMGEATLLPEDLSVWWRWAVVALLVLWSALITWLVRQSVRQTGSPSYAYLIGGVVAGVVAIAVAIAVVVLGAATVALDGAAVVALALALAVAFAGFGSDVVAAVAVAATVAVAFTFIQDLVRRRLQDKRRVFAVIWLMGTWAAVLAAAMAVAPRWADPIWNIDAGRPAFVLLFFMALMPVWNALLDLASVGVTRQLLRRYLRSGSGWLWMTLVDMAVAVGLSVLLFFGVLAMLKGMQALGWGVDADELVRRFLADPADPQVTWITWMALTNVLPTLLHLGLGCAGLLGSWLMRDEAFARRLNELREAPVPSPIVGIEAPAKTAASAPMKLAQGLSEPQAAKLLNWVYFDGWLAIAFPFAVAFAVWPLWPRLMTWPLALLVP